MTLLLQGERPKGKWGWDWERKCLTFLRKTLGFDGSGRKKMYLSGVVGDEGVKEKKAERGWGQRRLWGVDFVRHSIALSCGKASLAS